MKPMGTITKYYPFIDEESRMILDSLMDESSNYYDFVQRLTELVLEKQVSENLVYIATGQCWYAQASDLRNAILDKYNSFEIIKPWRYYWDTPESYNSENSQAILQSLDSAMMPPKDNWIAVELLLSHALRLVELLLSDAFNLGATFLSKANALIDQRTELLCFKPLAYLVESRMNYVEAKVAEAAALSRTAYELASENNDAMYEFLSILSLADSIKHKNPRESLSLFEQAYRIAQSLEVPVLIGETFHAVGLAYETLGEYDLAISGQLEYLDKSHTIDDEIISVVLSRLYASSGDGRQALEWANRSLDDEEFYVGYLRKARALIILNRLDEAEETLDIARQKVLRAGHDYYLAEYYSVSGLLDMAKGELANAMATLEQAYQILYPLERLAYLNETLIALATVEVTMLQRQSHGGTDAATGKWLSILENHARTFDMPGIAMRAALLRSEVFKSEGHLQDASETLRHALELSDSLGVRTLRNRIEASMLEIDRLMRDEGFEP
ncbi:MAG: hypothetical protein ACFFE2_14580 [Candidatus Thorarchaeota archaeon]